MSKLVLLIFFWIFSPVAAMGASAVITATVERSLTDIQNYGGCMVNLSVPINSVGLDCPANWVSFSCTGDFAPKDAALRNFDATLIAMLTNATVRIAVYDDKRHNSYCFGSRVELIP